MVLQPYATKLVLLEALNGTVQAYSYFRLTVILSSFKNTMKVDLN